VTSLAFDVKDVYLTGLHVERGPMKPSSDKSTLHAQIDFDVPAAEYSPGNVRVRVTTRFRIRLFLDGPPPEDIEPADAPNLIGTLETSFRANVDADRSVEESDAESGALEPAIDLAIPLIHPYHRAALESHSAMLGVSPLRLPVNWDVVAANLAGGE